MREDVHADFFCGAGTDGRLLQGYSAELFSILTARYNNVTKEKCFVFKFLR